MEEIIQETGQNHGDQIENSDGQVSQEDFSWI